MDELKGKIKYALPILDIVFVNTAYILALFFRFEDSIPAKYISAYKQEAVIITLVYLLFFWAFKLYSSIWTLASIDEFIQGLLSCIAAAVVVLVASVMFKKPLPITVYVMANIMLSVLVLGLRMSFRIFRRMAAILDKPDTSGYNRVLVVGAGEAACMVVKEMQRHSHLKYVPVAMVDDSKNKKGMNICGVKVCGNTSDIPRLAEKLKADTIAIAIPSMREKDRLRIIDLCNKTKCKVKILPGVYELIEGEATLSKMRDIDLKDLLGRSPVNLDKEGIASYIEGKVVMVTGGGGTIGSELCRQIADYRPKQLLILDIYENNAYDLQMELKRNHPELNLEVLIASVRDRIRLEKIFMDYKPEIIFHAAAHKHVPLMEVSPGEAIKNNVYGTLNVAECADKYKAKKFVLISTDKAVNPTNVMGCSKRICEMIVQAISRKSSTEFAAVRFGNVLGSSGSVIPLFQKQIDEGGPVTVTHKNITRFFMLIPEAVELVLQAGAFATGGEIFVLDMGKPMKIYELAEHLIRLNGYEPNVDIMIEVVGLRPGEKLYEEILMKEEGLKSTKHEKIFIGKPIDKDFDVLFKELMQLQEIIGLENKEAIIEELERIVPTYKPANIEAINKAITD